jgi:hypothetical protein
MTVKSIKHSKEKRVLIPSREEAGQEAASPKAVIGMKQAITSATAAIAISGAKPIQSIRFRTQSGCCGSGRLFRCVRQKRHVAAGRDQAVAATQHDVVGTEEQRVHGPRPRGPRPS